MRGKTGGSFAGSKKKGGGVGGCSCLYLLGMPKEVLKKQC